MSEAKRRARTYQAAALAAVLLLAAALVRNSIFTQFGLGDDGAMAHMADRVLHGDVPHRDFDEIWTGGWSVFQAQIFRVFGTSLTVLCETTVGTWLLGLTAMFLIAQRLSGLALGVIATVLGAIWSLAAWPYPLANWYYLTFGLWSIYAVLRFRESRRPGWLLLAGACSGLAFDFKMTGLFLLAALLLWGAYAAAEHRPESPESSNSRPSNSMSQALVLAAIAGYLAFVFVLIRPLPKRPATMLYFLAPNLLLVVPLTFRARAAGARFSNLLRHTVPLAAGFVLGVLPLLLQQIAAGSLGKFFTGVFVDPRRRYSIAEVLLSPPSGSATIAMMLPVLVLVFGASRVRASGRKSEILTAALLGTGLAVLANGGEAQFGMPLNAMRAMPFALVIVMTAIETKMFAWRGDTRSDTRGRIDDGTFLLVAVATTSQLVQVPYAHWSYFIYGTPFVILGALAVMKRRGAAATPTAALAFGLTFLVVLGLSRPGVDRREAPTAPLPFARGGIQVAVANADAWTKLAAIVDAHAKSPYIFVSRDAPIYYFLLDRQNPTRFVFELLADSTARAPEAIRAQLARANVNLVIIDWPFRQNTTRGDRERLAMLRADYPNVERIGEQMEVRWREPLRSAAVTRASAP